ncbi:Hypothetical predicted protein [Olea europaea subsp. europaea]|uniref:Uncharacterized protein n=1 Tax=Olea europaea subsp. europaea TaxID=158383 RepID=A0A8S0V994_OLEEU|nr:Hypothetical predicted protein [Olea europaea subsp. europaea]
MKRRRHRRDQESPRSVTGETTNHSVFTSETIDPRVEAPTLELRKAPIATSMRSASKRETTKNHRLQIEKRKELHVASCCVASHAGAGTSLCCRAPFVINRRV